MLQTPHSKVHIIPSSQVQYIWHEGRQHQQMRHEGHQYLQNYLYIQLSA
jgi:hypothetical protein